MKTHFSINSHFVPRRSFRFLFIQLNDKVLCLRFNKFIKLCSLCLCWYKNYKNEFRWLHSLNNLTGNNGSCSQVAEQCNSDSSFAIPATVINFFNWNKMLTMQHKNVSLINYAILRSTSNFVSAFRFLVRRRWWSWCSHALKKQNKSFWK